MCIVCVGCGFADRKRTDELSVTLCWQQTIENDIALFVCFKQTNNVLHCLTRLSDSVICDRLLHRR